jgi:hypothetical protein
MSALTALPRTVNTRTGQCVFTHAEHLGFRLKPMDAGAPSDCIAKPHPAPYSPHRITHRNNQMKCSLKTSAETLLFI